ncbi:hypothetical protein [Sphingobium yanoikuyae]|jgi:hypothetical protein
MIIDRQKFQEALVEHGIILDTHSSHMLVARIEQLLRDERDAVLPGRLDDFLGRRGTAAGDANIEAWLAGRRQADAYIKRLIKRPNEPPLPLPPMVAGLDPLCSAIGDLLDLPNAADWQYIIALADACRSGTPALERSGIKNLKILKTKRGPKRRDERWRIIAGGVYQFFNQDGSTAVERLQNPAKEREVRQIIRAFCCLLDICVTDSSVSRYLTKLRNGLADKGSIPNQIDHRRVRDDEINEKLFSLGQPIGAE